MNIKGASSRGGETGRHARLKIWWALARVGSSPTLGTMQKTESGERKTGFSLVSRFWYQSLFYSRFLIRGSSSVVEHNLAKVGVAGSTPVSRSIFTLFLLLLFFTNSFAKQFELKSYYTFKSSCITLRSLGIDDSNSSCIIKLSKSRNRWEIPAYKLIKALKTKGISVKHPSSSTIIFEKKIDLDLLALKKELEKLYLQKYPTMQIKNISIFPTSLHNKNFIFNPSKCSINLSKSMLKRNRGTFAIKCDKRNYFFKFYIDATLDVYKANIKIKKDKIIDSKAIRKETITFKTIYSLPVYDMERRNVMAKRNIAQDKIITLSMISPIPAVKKHETVNCFLQDGAVHIEFNAEAMQNGYIGDEIVLKREDGQTIKGVVLKKNLVEIK